MGLESPSAECQRRKKGWGRTQGRPARQEGAAVLGVVRSGHRCNGGTCCAPALNERSFRGGVAAVVDVSFVTKAQLMVASGPRRWSCVRRGRSGRMQPG